MNVFTGRGGGRMQIDQGEMRHEYEAVAAWDDMGPCAPVVRML